MESTLAASGVIRCVPWQRPHALARQRGGTFFKSQTKRSQRLVHQSGACRDLVNLKQPGAQFGDRRIGTAGHLRQDCRMQAAQLGHHVTALRPRRLLPGSLRRDRTFET